MLLTPQCRHLSYPCIGLWMLSYVLNYNDRNTNLIHLVQSSFAAAEWIPVSQLQKTLHSLKDLYFFSFCNVYTIQSVSRRVYNKNISPPNESEVFIYCTFQRLLSYAVEWLGDIYYCQNYAASSVKATVTGPTISQPICIYWRTKALAGRYNVLKLATDQFAENITDIL